MHRLFRVVFASAIFAGLATVLFRGCGASPNVVTFRDLEHQLGVYALANATDVPSARRMGAQLVLAQDGGDTTLTRALAEHHMKYIDASIKALLYHAYCPSGPASCRPPSPSGLAALFTAVRAHVVAVSDKHMIAAYYILDDYYADMAPGLEAVYRAIRTVDRTTPTLCAFNQNLAYLGPGGSLVAPTRPFQRALRNYSPSWCDAVGIYSYAPAAFGAKAPATPAVEWDMSTTLPYIIRTLKAKGWDPAHHPLVGMPGAFGYEPRLGLNGQAPLAEPEWLFAPTAGQLAQQVGAYCAAGAQAILAYVWNDKSQGTSIELFNSPTLRQGLQRGVTACRSRYWR